MDSQCHDIYGVWTKKHRGGFWHRWERLWWLVRLWVVVGVAKVIFKFQMHIFLGCKCSAPAPNNFWAGSIHWTLKCQAFRPSGPMPISLSLLYATIPTRSHSSLFNPKFPLFNPTIIISIPLSSFQSHYHHFNPTLCTSIPLSRVYIYYPSTALPVYTLPTFHLKGMIYGWSEILRNKLKYIQKLALDVSGRAVPAHCIFWGLAEYRTWFTVDHCAGDLSCRPPYELGGRNHVQSMSPQILVSRIKSTWVKWPVAYGKAVRLLSNDDEQVNICGHSVPSFWKLCTIVLN